MQKERVRKRVRDRERERGGGGGRETETETEIRKIADIYRKEERMADRRREMFIKYELFCLFFN